MPPTPARPGPRAHQHVEDEARGQTNAAGFVASRLVLFMPDARGA
jgi:hypothetical protein